MRALLLALPLVAVFALPADAQDSVCHAVFGYDVLEVENTEGIGTRFAVKRVDATTHCAFSEADADFVLGSEDDPFHFAAINDAFLIVNRSFGPQGQLVFFDLAEQDIVLDVLADEVEVDDEGATFWERIDEGTAQNCPEYAGYRKDGFGADIAAETRFEFATRESTPTGKQRCDPAQ
jgi:hypothetical protein